MGKGRGQSRPFSCSKGRGAASQATKSSPNFWGPREGKKRTPPGKAEKGGIGCVLGAGGDGGRTWPLLRVLLPGGERPAPSEGAAETGTRWEAGKGRRCPVPATKHKTGGAGLGPGESSEGRSDAAWLAGETAGYPAKVPFRRPLVWRFCQKGRIVLDIRWKKGYSKEEFWQEANGKARMLSQVERDQCFENST